MRCFKDDRRGKRLCLISDVHLFAISVGKQCIERRLSSLQPKGCAWCVKPTTSTSHFIDSYHFKFHDRKNSHSPTHLKCDTCFPKPNKVRKDFFIIDRDEIYIDICMLHVCKQKLFFHFKRVLSEKRIGWLNRCHMSTFRVPFDLSTMILKTVLGNEQQLGCFSFNNVSNAYNVSLMKLHGMILFWWTYPACFCMILS